MDSANKQYLDLMLTEKTFNYSLGKAQEHLNMNTRKIYNLPEPTEDRETATKGYVDCLFNRLRNTV